MTAGYSGTPMARKLGLKAGHRLALVGAPEGWEVPDPPEGVAAVREPAPGSAEPADLVLAFFRAAAEIAPALPGLGARVFPDGAVWAAWPRKAGGHRSDIAEATIRDAALPLGLVDVKVAALDDKWSGLRLVWRRERRRASPGAHGPRDGPNTTTLPPAQRTPAEGWSQGPEGKT